MIDRMLIAFCAELPALGLNWYEVASSWSWTATRACPSLPGFRREKNCRMAAMAASFGQRAGKLGRG
eukprot:2014196-Heterocapsa_arctica.AAC.1